MANITEKEQLEAIRSSFGTQASNFESSAMNFTKQEFLDYTMRRVFSVQYTSEDILGHPAVKELLSKEATHDFKHQP